MFVNRTYHKIPRPIVLKHDIRRVLGRLKSGAKPRTESFSLLPGKKQAKLDAISIVFITTSESRRLNRQFLNRLHPANVLSFRYDAQAEIIITPAVLLRQARLNARSYDSELRRMVLHGLLHLLGYHHEDSNRQAMTFEKLEQRFLRHLKIT